MTYRSPECRNTNERAVSDSTDGQIEDDGPIPENNK